MFLDSWFVLTLKLLVVFCNSCVINSSRFDSVVARPNHVSQPYSASVSAHWHRYYTRICTILLVLVELPPIISMQPGSFANTGSILDGTSERFSTALV